MSARPMSIPERDDRAWADYSRDFRTRVLPKLMDSATFLSIGVPEPGDFDVKQATELGAALFLDKPIILVSAKGGPPLNEHLKRCADAVVEDFDPQDPLSQQHILDAMRSIGMVIPNQEGDS